MAKSSQNGKQDGQVVPPPCLILIDKDNDEIFSHLLEGAGGVFSYVKDPGAAIRRGDGLPLLHLLLPCAFLPKLLCMVLNFDLLELLLCN